MKKIFFNTFVLFFISTLLNAQEKKEGMYIPSIAIKTNALYWATTTPNLGFEIGLSKKMTLDISGNYNPWELADNKKIKHWLVQPELRYWLCERFNGHFLGVHAHYAEYNIGGLNILGLDKNRYQGNLYGGGISYGYQWILSNHWSIEATVGLGYAHLDHDKYTCGDCGTKLKKDEKNYWGATKAGLSIVYILK